MLGVGTSLALLFSVWLQGAVSAVPASNLERGLAALSDLDLPSAGDLLASAEREGPYRWRDAVALYEALGIVRAYLGDEEGALRAFEVLLALDPPHSLAYTTSPKATFLFERVRTEFKTRRSTQVRLVPPAVVPFETPLELVVERTADPLDLIRTVSVHYRLKGDAKWAEAVIEAPPVGERARVVLPAYGEADAFTDDRGQLGAIVEVAVLAKDRRGWEVHRAPPLDQPVEVPVGFDAPGPWYTQWWVWALGGAGVAVGAAAVATAGGAGVAAYLLWPEPMTVSGHTVVVGAAAPHGGPR